mmetsp:Transcript_15592/g.13631  ORF Transcript_15592/g.13631 Transcript_15592/m.13631 type:complete len:107 (+) Transcript_15592:134-454(+)
MQKVKDSITPISKANESKPPAVSHQYESMYCTSNGSISKVSGKKNTSNTKFFKSRGERNNANFKSIGKKLMEGLNKGKRKAKLNKSFKNSNKKGNRSHLPSPDSRN